MEIITICNIVRTIRDRRGAGAGAGGAETFYSEPESEPETFKTFKQLLYDLLLTKFCSNIF